MAKQIEGDNENRLGGLTPYINPTIIENILGKAGIGPQKDQANNLDEIDTGIPTVIDIKNPPKNFENG